MISKLTFGALAGFATGIGLGYPMLGTIPGAIGLSCSVTAIIWGAQFGFTPEQDDEEL